MKSMHIIVYSRLLCSRLRIGLEWVLWCVTIWGLSSWLAVRGLLAVSTLNWPRLWRFGELLL
jgi:hypothetical protein